MPPTPIEIVPIREEWIETLREAVGSVAEERLFLNTLEAFSLNETRSFVKMLLEGGGIQFVAMNQLRVVGWCDVVRHHFEGTRHGGVLGMGVLHEFRGLGIGPRLLDKTLEAAKRAGIDRVELEVFSTNEPAIALYERNGFVLEGRKQRARILDGIESDILMMAKFP